MFTIIIKTDFAMFFFKSWDEVYAWLDDGKLLSAQTEVNIFTRQVFTDIKRWV
jgi:hypothetical protein